jgi:hypothetical protein
LSYSRKDWIPERPPKGSLLLVGIFGSPGGCFPSYSSRVAGAIKELPLALVVGTHPALPSSRNAARSISVFQYE